MIHPVLASWPDQLRALFDAFAVRLQEERQRHAEEIVEAVEGVESEEAEYIGTVQWGEHTVKGIKP